MKSYLLLFVAFFLSSSLLWANDLHPHDRGTLERLSGSNALLPLSQTIELGREIMGPADEQKISRLQLVSPERSPTERALNLESKRSIILIDSSNFSDLDEGLQQAIQKVTNNRSNSIKEQGVQYRQTGLENFYILANFEASQTASLNSEWFVAIIPHTVVVEKVILQTEWFGTGAGAHNQVRMILDTPVVGILQNPHNSGDYQPFVFDYDGKGDIVYSLQAARTRGGEQESTPFRGVMGEYGNALQFFDTRTLALDQIRRSIIDDLTVLDLEQASTPQQVQDMKTKTKAILTQAISESDSEQELSIYNTIFASCVTYAMKALKAGIPNVDTTWFNPYSINLKIQEILGSQWSLEKSSMNDLYGPLVETMGAEVMTWARVRQEHEKTYNLVQALKVPLLQNDQFDQLVQKVAIFIAHEKINYDQIQKFMVKVNEPDVNLKKIANTDMGQRLVIEIDRLWKDQFPDRPLSDFFKSLQGLQTQPGN